MQQNENFNVSDPLFPPFFALISPFATSVGCTAFVAFFDFSGE
jgi:hypothetical protein